MQAQEIKFVQLKKNDYKHSSHQFYDCKRTNADSVQFLLYHQCFCKFFTDREYQLIQFLSILCVVK